MVGGYQKFPVHGLPWELRGKIRESGSMGAWERHGKGRESKAQEPSRRRGKLGGRSSRRGSRRGRRAAGGGAGAGVGTKLVRASYRGKGPGSRLPKILCSNLMLVQSRSVHRL